MAVEAAGAPSNTRRGLLLALWANGAAGVAALAALVLRGGGALVALALLAAMLLALGAVYFLWTGRFEFHEGHGRWLRWGLQFFVLAVALLLGILVAVSSTVPETLRVADLRAPVILVPLLHLAEAAAAGLSFWRLASGSGRVALAGHGAVAVVASVVLFLRGLRLVDDLVMRFGETVRLEATARDAVAVFLEEYLASWMAFVLVGRALVGYAVWDALGRTIQEERARP